MNNRINPNRSYRYTILAMRFLEKILGSKITVEGLSNIPSQPVLFVANHFTRSETFIVPYIIRKNTNRQIRCLGDQGLFNGILGKFLRSVGAISTKDKNRDSIIISDLVYNKYDWMIFPEGSMIKNKDIDNNGKRKYATHKLENSEKNRVRTGSAILAIKSQLYREAVIEAKQKNNLELLEYYKTLGISFEEQLNTLETHIVPVNITYYPIRPGKNFIQKIVKKIFKKLPSGIAEELEIEGNLLLSSNINISFSPSINIKNHIQSVKNRIYHIPLISHQIRTELVLRYFRHSLTNQFMNIIYSNAQINIDHIAVAILYFYRKTTIDIKHFKTLIFLITNQIIYLKDYRVNKENSLNIIKLIAQESFLELDDFIHLATTLKIIKRSEDKKNYIINKTNLAKKYNSNQIRLDNTPQVILNEFFLLENAVAVVRKAVDMTLAEIKGESFQYLVNKDLADFEADYQQYYNPELSKNKEIGKPVFLDNKTSQNKETTGILLVHGYLSAPKEMEEMAQYLNKLGFKTYLVRLKGHGTSPINLEDIKWQDWYQSLNCGYAALKLVCRKVFIVGFSTGGLLALVAAVKKKNKINGIICINPAMKIQDIRARLISGVQLWNDVLKKFKINKGQLRFVENHSENPQTNYSLNYINGIEQLEFLMNFCRENLEKITCPALIIQSQQDPVIDAAATKKILNHIHSQIKKFKEIISSKHCIVKGESSQEVFDDIVNFIEKTSIKKQIY